MKYVQSNSNLLWNRTIRISHTSASDTMRFGLHIMIDGYCSNSASMTDVGHMRKLLDELPGEMGMHSICSPVVVEVGPNCHKDPGGVSGFVMIAESHISFHTFPARGFVTIDFYTCQDTLNDKAFCKRLTDAFGIEDADIYIQERGVRYPAADLDVSAPLPNSTFTAQRQDNAI